MASSKVLETKKAIVNEIIEKIKNSESVILFSYQGLTVSELSELRKKLREASGEVKVYKNTLLKRALDELKIDMTGFLDGPNAIMFGKDLLEPIKIISEFEKKHENLEIRIGIISGKKAELETIKEYASIPSYEGLITMLASGLMAHVKKLAIGLDLYAKKLEN